MRYRCKLCGQPKQNHICTFNQTLQRSIGAQVYPAVNAFTSHEPGSLAQNLLDMSVVIGNNNAGDGSSDNSPARQSVKGRGGAILASQPDAPPSTPFNAPTTRHSVRMNVNKVTPETPAAAPSTVVSHSNINAGSNNTAAGNNAAMSLFSGQKHHPASNNSNNNNNQGDVLFVDMVDLKPECYRIITPTTQKNLAKKASKSTAYRYPKLPLAYVQRKRLSDYLFSLTKEKEGLTDETAAILRDGRENDSDYWDVCIAELLTQVIVVLHCSSTSTSAAAVVAKGNSHNNSNSTKEDGATKDASSSLLSSGNNSNSAVDYNRLGGLSRFLLQIGIAC